MEPIYKPYITDEEQLRILEESMTGLLEYSLMNDFLSKYSFQKDLYALSGLLAALLRVDVDDITSIEILNPVEPAEIINDKNCVLDIKLELNHNEIINLEIQSRFQDFWPERSLTYLCRIFNDLEEGQSYGDTKPCIQIGILGHDLFRKDDDRYTGKFYSEYRMMEVDNQTEYTSKFQIRVLSLNHLEEASEEEKKDPNGLYFWAKLLTARSWEEMKMVAEENPRMKSFVGTVRQLTAEQKVAEACERRRRYNRDIATYEAEIAAYAAEKEKIEEEMAATKEEMAASKKEIAANKKEIAASKKEIAANKKEIAASEAELAKKDLTIEAQAEEIEAKDQEISRLLKQIEELKNGL